MMMFSMLRIMMIIIMTMMPILMLRMVVILAVMMMLGGSSSLKREPTSSMRWSEFPFHWDPYDDYCVDYHDDQDHNDNDYDDQVIGITICIGILIILSIFLYVRIRRACNAGKYWDRVKIYNVKVNLQLGSGDTAFFKKMNIFIEWIFRYFFEWIFFLNEYFCRTIEWIFEWIKKVRYSY